MSARTGSDARLKTRRRREARCEGTIEQPFGEPHVDVECPICGETIDLSGADDLDEAVDRWNRHVERSRETDPDAGGSQ